MAISYRAVLAAYLGLAALIVVWNIAAAGRIIQSRRAPPIFAGATAFGALLLIPALLVAVSGASFVYGRAIQPVAWVWPVVAVLFVIHAIVALARGLVTPIVGVPVLVYDSIIALVAIARYAASRGLEPPDFALVLSAAQTNALGHVGGSAVLSHATWLLVPMFSPALPPRSRLKVALRTLLAAGVTLAAAIVLVELPAAAEAIGSYQRYDGDVLTERRDGHFEFGMKVFPDLRGAPPPIAIANDLGLVDSLNVGAVSIVVDPEAARGKALDSLAHVLENVRDDSTALIVTLGYSRDARALMRRSQSAYVDQRLDDVNRLTRALRPNIFVPALEPYGEGTRVLGTQPPSFWIDYVTRAAAIAHHVNPNIKIGLAAASYGSRDSALYAWASARTSPVDVPGFSLMPGFDGATSLDTHLRIAQRWLRMQDRPKDNWVYSAGGYPIVHGEQSQTMALHGILAWATAQPAIVGVVITEAGDYDSQTGLRSPDGRFRRALQEVTRAMRSEHESAAAQ
ncbi:MAG: hypothetical protein ACR2M1_02110 [Gemmatimonadaceae bacterium]